MFISYLKIAWRNLLKQKCYSFINVIGLAVGMTCFLFIMLYVQHELSYDRFHAQAGRIYRFAREAITTHGTRAFAGTPYPLGPPFKQGYPEVEKLTRFYFYGRALVAAKEKRIYEESFVFADSDFFAIFSFPINSLYQAEEKTERIASAFSMLAMVVACLGLFGLVSYATEQRTKEIGICKVLGASVAGIVNLLSSDFTRLVLAANLIAWPVTYYAMSKWLQNFAYRIDIGWWMFALAGGLTLLIAVLTVSSQAIKAALANPVENLRYE